MSDSTELTPREFLEERRREYIRAFDTPAGKMVLEDLAPFCRADASTFHIDARVSANLDGRREVYLRIQEHINLSSDELWAKYGSASNVQNETD